MSQQPGAVFAKRPSPWWFVVGARAVAAVITGLIITFSADHSARFGLLVFGAFALASALVLVWGARAIGVVGAAGLLYVQAAASAVAGIIALTINGSGYGMLVALIVGWAIVTGVTEIVLWHRMRVESAFARDWLTGGILTLVLAAAVLVIPADFANAWQVEDKDGGVLSGVVTAEIFAVGVLGAYAFVLGMFLLIAAVSARGVKGAVPRSDSEFAREPSRQKGE
ncbi:MAG: hypothetical protein KF680_08860 [Cryobacterium sp.]|nr:hypothetical protein [Cryobacterium sp.]